MASPRSAHATWVMNISLLLDGSTLSSVFEHWGETFVTPASNNKLVTTSAFFTANDMRETFKTTVTGGAGSLCLQTAGAGDFSYEDLSTLAQQVDASEGPFELWVTNAFDLLPAGWEWDDTFYYYGAPPMSAVLNQNVIELLVSSNRTVHVTNALDANTVTVNVDELVTVPKGNGTAFGPSYRITDASGPVIYLSGTIEADIDPVPIVVAVHTPAQRVGQAFANALCNGTCVHAIHVVGDACPTTMPVVATVESASYAAIMNHTLTVSDNLEAELFFRHFGGAQAVQQQLVKLGVDVSAIHQTDGSGLGRMNLLTANGVVSLLYAMRAEHEWISFLPVGGETGTLADRYRCTPAQGRVHAKTGTLTGVNSLSGYVNSINNRTYIFSIISNGTPLSHSAEIHELVDPIVVAMAKC